MKTILNKIGAIRLTPRHFFGAMAIIAAVLTTFYLSSCNDDLDVQQSYPFTVEVMPYGDKITKGQTVELRFEIKPEGNYTNTLYTIRYFQYDGEGTLKLVDTGADQQRPRFARKQDLPPQLYRKILRCPQIPRGDRGQFRFYSVGTDL